MPTATPRCCGSYEGARGCAITWDDSPNGKVSNVDFVKQLEEESKKPGVVARNDGDPRPHRFRRMAPPLTGRSLIPHPPTEGWGSMKRILCSLLVATLPFGSVLADAPKSKNAKVTLVYQHELPNVPGKSIKGVLVEYGPGGYSPAHTHPKSAFIYATVLEGAIRSQVNDGPVTTYKAGQSFSELPGDRHGVSANASKTKPAKLLAVFVVDANETELTIPFGN